MTISPFREQPIERTDFSIQKPPLVLPKRLFGTDGIRGQAGALLTPSFVLHVGFCAGKVLQASATALGPVIVGQDSRTSSDMLAMAIAAGLTSAGVEVWNLGLCPTPCVAYLTSVTEAIGGIMISASHNPPADNGIKFFGENGKKLSAFLTGQIEAQLRSADSAPRPSTNANWGQYRHRPALVTEYGQALKRSLSQVDFTNMRIVLDLAWGAAVELAPTIFASLGAEVVALHNQPRGDRINVHCGSTHLEPLKAAVRTHQASLGVAFDGDADRVIAVDSQGRIVDGDYILYLWGKHLKEHNQLPENLIVATVMANLGFERAWQAEGGQLIRTAVGDQHVQEQMWQTGAMLGGEQSGHIICHHYGISGDGIQTALHLTALICQAGASLAELVEQSFQTYPQILSNVRVSEENRSRWQECHPVQKAIDSAQAALGETGRILVRASGTEPVIRVMVEAAEFESASYWSQQLVQEVQQHLGA
ncbi:MAG: phosphoglucosamine mutase [Cyanophyceae cyanobacterium]